MSLHDLASPSTSSSCTSNNNNSPFTADLKWIPFISSSSNSNPGQGQSHGQVEQGPCGRVETGRINKSPPLLRLSPTIKGLIRSYIGCQSLSPESLDPGTEPWVDGLFRFVESQDARVKKEDIRRWIRAHRWILNEANYGRPTTFDNFPFDQNNRRINEMQLPIFGNGGGNGPYFLSEQQQQHNSNAMPAFGAGTGFASASAGTGTGNGPAGARAGNSQPLFERSSSQQKLEQLQSLSKIVMTLNKALRANTANGLEEVRAHVDCLNPLINTISRVTRNILKGASRPEILAQQVQVQLNPSDSGGRDSVFARKQETATEIPNAEEGEGDGDGDRESDDDDGISSINPVVL